MGSPLCFLRELDPLVTNGEMTGGTAADSLTTGFDLCGTRELLAAGLSIGGGALGLAVLG